MSHLGTPGPHRPLLDLRMPSCSGSELEQSHRGQAWLELELLGG